MSDKKNEIIAEVYNDFYGSISSTFKDAHKKDPSITLQDVKNFFNNKFVRKTQLKGYNSYVANYPHQEYQMDLFFINDLENQDYTIGLLLVDIFTKWLTVVPVKSKQADDILEAIKKGIKQMGDKPPEMLYTDEEGSFHSKQAETYYKDNMIKHIITRTHAPVAERGIRTIKDMIYKRLESNHGLKWTDPDILSNALVAYNYKMKHNTTHMTPSEARQDKNVFEVKTQLEMHKIKKRKYPDIAVGDEVRIYTKKRNFVKERYGVWSQNKYKVIKIDHSHGQDFYHIEGNNKAFLRHEILKL